MNRKLLRDIAYGRRRKEGKCGRPFAFASSTVELDVGLERQLLGYHKTQMHLTKKQRTFKPGCSIGVGYRTGSWGGLVRDAKTGNLGVMTAAHVAGYEDTVTLQQPGFSDYRDSGHKWEFTPSECRHILSANGDAAVVFLEPSLERVVRFLHKSNLPANNMEFIKHGTSIGGLAYPDTDEILYSTGRGVGNARGRFAGYVETNIKYGQKGVIPMDAMKIVPLAIDGRQPYPDLPEEMGEIEISAPSCSGKWWWAFRDGKWWLVGCHYAGERSRLQPEVAIAAYAPLVFKELGVELVKGL